MNEIKQLAIDEVDNEIADELDGMKFTLLNNETIEFDEDDVKDIRVRDDMDEVIVDDIDFDDEEADLLVTVKFEQDDYDFKADVLVTIDDGEVDDFEIVEVREE